MAEAAELEIEVVYALAERQTRIRLSVPRGTTVADALARSAIARLHREIDLNAADVGIFGERVSPTTILEDHDRVEIYRPLIADPRQARRRRARGPRTR